MPSAAKTQAHAVLDRHPLERALLLCRTASGAYTGCSTTCSGLVCTQPTDSHSFLYGCKVI